MIDEFSFNWQRIIKPVLILSPKKKVWKIPPRTVYQLEGPSSQFCAAAVRDKVTNYPMATFQSDRRVVKCKYLG